VPERSAELGPRCNADTTTTTSQAEPASTANKSASKPADTAPTRAKKLKIEN
jgi:hypothetical protein